MRKLENKINLYNADCVKAFKISKFSDHSLDRRVKIYWKAITHKIRNGNKTNGMYVQRYQTHKLRNSTYIQPNHKRMQYNCSNK